MAESSTCFSLSTSNLHHLITIVSVKLSASNYLIWRMQILPLIQSLKLMDHLNGSPPIKTMTTDNKEVPNPKFDDWQYVDLLLRSWITGTLSEEALGHVVGMITAKDVWMCLEETYLQATKERELHLKRQLQVPKKENTSLAAYLVQFKTICDSLAAIQKPVSDEDKTVQLSHGLGKKYDIFVTTMLSKPPFPTFNQFVTALQSYDIRHQGTDADDKAPSTLNQNFAFAAQRYGGRGRGFGRGRSNGQHFNSRGRGFTQVAHVQNAPNRGQFATPNRSSPGQFYASDNRGNHSHRTDQATYGEMKSHNAANSPPKCQICDGIGHTATRCWYRYDYAYDQNANLSQALASTTLSDIPDQDPTWYTDTGATSHMTSNKDLGSTNRENTGNGA
uniref:Retrotransposon Copia-like N-terminal domain-containing protein n=1 Tax=Davidia involucrata TaxID=16924 RepID=A0A5B6YY77_DAVIN